MKTLTKKFRVIHDGSLIRNADYRKEQTGTTYFPDNVGASEFDTLLELDNYVAQNGLLCEAQAGDGDEAQTPPPPTIEDYEHAVEAILQECADNHRYDDIVSACSYASVENPFQAESAAILAWRGNVWAWCYGLLANPPAVLPTIAEFRASLLAAWPMP